MHKSITEITFPTKSSDDNEENRINSWRSLTGGPPEDKEISVKFLNAQYRNIESPPRSFSASFSRSTKELKNQNSKISLSTGNQNEFMNMNILQSQRSFIIKELLTSEQSYVEGLQIVIEGYYKPLLEEKILPPEILDTIIHANHFRTIVNMHQNISRRLQERVEESNDLEEVIISDILDDYSSLFLSPYLHYAVNYDKAMVQLRKQQKELPKLDPFLKNQKQSEITKQKDLESYLITVIQRLPRYVLLLRELISNTKENHRDYNNLCNTMEKIQDILDKINSEKKKYQMKEQCIKIHELFGLEKEMPLARTLVFESKISKNQKKARVSVQSKLFSKTYKLLLFNDIIMLTKTIREDEEILDRKYNLFEAVLSTYHEEGLGDTAITFANVVYLMPNSEKREELFKYYSKVVAKYALTAEY